MGSLILVLCSETKFLFIVPYMTPFSILGWLVVELSCSCSYAMTVSLFEISY